MHIKRRFSITKKYSVIYADPPWRYERSKVQGAAEKHYPTMGIDELCALPVPELAAKDCSPVFVGDLSAASRSSAADPRMGLSVSDGGVRLAQT